MPPVLQGTRAVKEIAQIYLDGDKEASLPSSEACIADLRGPC